MAHKDGVSKGIIVLAVMGLAGGLFFLLLMVKLIVDDLANRVSFTSYEDVQNLFSIDYPSTFYVASRTIENSTLSVDFRPTGGESSEFLSVMAYPETPDVYFNKSNIKLQATVGDPSIELEKYYMAICNPDGDRYGFYHPREEDGKLYKIFIYHKHENNFIIQVLYFIDGEEKYDEYVLEHIFYSLKWSPVEVAQQLH